MSLAEIQSEFQKLRISDKLNLLESLWEASFRDYQSQPVPKAHVKAIKERYEQLKNGTAKTDSWENVKRRLLSGNGNPIT